MNTKENFGYTKGQLSILVLLRVLIGWHFLYEGIVKVLNPNWSSLGYLMDSQGFLSGFFHSLASNPNVLQVVDYLNMYGLLAIGLGLILGCFTQIATIAGMVLLALYYLSHIPFVGASYALPTDGSYLWVDKTLIELVALAVLFVLPTGRHIGLDKFIFGKNAD